MLRLIEDNELHKRIHPIICIQNVTVISDIFKIHKKKTLLVLKEIIKLTMIV